MRRSSKPLIGLCHFCGTEMRGAHLITAAIDPTDRPCPDMPEIGWVICSPLCPKLPADRPGLMVVQR